jgi:hypothetical protein
MNIWDFDGVLYLPKRGESWDAVPVAKQLSIYTQDIVPEADWIVTGRNPSLRQALSDLTLIPPENILCYQTHTFNQDAYEAWKVYHVLQIALRADHLTYIYEDQESIVRKIRKALAANQPLPHPIRVVLVGDPNTRRLA